MSDSVRSHRRQPTRLPRPWDSPGKNTGVGCHFLLQCRKVKSESEVAQSCPTLCDAMDCSLPGSPIHGISQARVLEWVNVYIIHVLYIHVGFPGGASGKESASQCRRYKRRAFNPWVRKICWRKGKHGNPLQYSCLENSIDRGAWRVTVHRVAKS